MNWLEEVKRVINGISSGKEEELRAAIRELKCTPLQIGPHVTEPKDLPYGRNVIHRTDQVEAIVIYLPPLQSTFIHDHGKSVGCAYIVQGTMVNTIYKPNDRGKAEFLYEYKLNAGECFYAGPGQVHAMRNPSNKPLITFHLYSPPLQKANRYEAEWVLDFVI